MTTIMVETSGNLPVSVAVPTATMESSHISWAMVAMDNK
jgi:hypothetical protein